MYELMIRDGFAAAHNLRGYRGRCEHVHGHNYTVEAYFTSEKLDGTGLAVDFNILKKSLKKITDSLDHKYLNKDIPFFRKNNTSAENIAIFVYSGLKKSVKKAKVSKVCIWESEGSMAAYYEKSE
ncbi:MAG: 6-carboxytetrahydropterin synthase [Spirochaetia bacterium]|nr:6-carboxytetrahydropterin synthase [Spirochaetia bacterium]